MAITRLKVSNFKSFDELEVDLRPLSVVVGANAAGKSNFLEIFRFIRDLAAHGLENAVSLQGGMEYLANLKIGAKRPVSLEVTFDFPQILPVRVEENELWVASVFESTYKLTLGWEGNSGFRVVQDQVVHCCHYQSGLSGSERHLGDGEIRISKVAGEVEVHFLVSKLEDAWLIDEGLGMALALGKGRAEDVLINSNFFIFPRLAESLVAFDLDPKLSKLSTALSGKADLEPDGSNLAIVLRGLLRDEEKRRTFFRILQDVLPFVQDLKVDRFSDKSLLLTLKESYTEDSFLPATFLSDGTIHLVALIVVLYFEEAAVMVLEEPERNIHPHLVSRVVSMLKDASHRKQIITTTHSPEVVRSVELDDLLLVHRDEHGFSRVTRPAENEDLKVFLENDFGIDELYVQSLLVPRNGV
jgi:predicted ATPase